MASSSAADGSGPRSAPGSPMPQRPCRWKPRRGAPGRRAGSGKGAAAGPEVAECSDTSRRGEDGAATAAGTLGWEPLAPAADFGPAGVGAALYEVSIPGSMGPPAALAAAPVETSAALAAGASADTRWPTSTGSSEWFPPADDEFRAATCRRCRCRCLRGRGRRRTGRVGPFGIVVQPVLDHLERQEVLPLLAEHPAQALHIVLVELPVARGSPLGVHQSLTLQKADLRDGDVGEFLSQERQHVADGQIRPAAHRASAPTATPGTGALIRPRPPGTRA